MNKKQGRPDPSVPFQWDAETLEAATEAAIRACDGDTRAARPRARSRQRGTRSRTGARGGAAIERLRQGKAACGEVKRTGARGKRSTVASLPIRSNAQCDAPSLDQDKDHSFSGRPVEAKQNIFWLHCEDMDMLFEIDEAERLLILRALNSEVAINENRSRQISRLVSKISHSVQHPNISVGVHGGQVQWVLGNPFPVRICDYDGEREDLPDMDERGQQCRIWFEPADSTAVNRDG